MAMARGGYGGGLRRLLAVARGGTWRVSIPVEVTRDSRLSIRKEARHFFSRRRPHHRGAALLAFDAPSASASSLRQHPLPITASLGRRFTALGPLPPTPPPLAAA